MYIYKVLESRLRDRGTETQESISVRLLNAGEEIVYGKTEVSERVPNAD